MKILHVIPTMAPEQGGPDIALLGLCGALVQQGHQVSIYTTNITGRGDFRLSPRRCRFLDVPVNCPAVREGVAVWHFEVSWPSWWRASWPMARALAQAVPDFHVVHIHSLYAFPTWAAAHFCRAAGVPYLIRPHGSLDPFLRRRKRLLKFFYEHLLERRNLNRAAAIHYTSEAEKRLVEPLRLKAPAVVVPLGVHFEEYRKLPPRGTFRTTHPEIGGRKIVLFLGRINFKKGLDVLARAFGHVGATRPDVHLVIAGPDNEGYSRQVRRWLEESGGIERTSFTGMLLGKDKLAALVDADVWVLPSYTENFGLALVEALACGIPAVISDRVNIWPEVKAAGAGLVVRCDPQETAEAILKLLANPVLAREMGARGRRWVEDNLTWKAVGEQMVRVYEEIVRRNSAQEAFRQPLRAPTGW